MHVRLTNYAFYLKKKHAKIKCLITDDMKQLESGSDRLIFQGEKNSTDLKSIFANVEFMHEFTDGCSAQYYKSQNCLANVNTCKSKIGYKVLIQNFHETFHG